MKIQKTTQPATFQPVVLTITIETEKEFLAILNMASGYYSVPDTLIKEDEIFEEHREPIEDFLKSINSALITVEEAL